MLGLTLATVTSTVSESEAPSESLTVTLTMGSAGPSGNEQSKLPAPVAGLKVSSPSWVPPVPQVVAPRVKVSLPGSVTLNE
jgi:hypothetical protein